MSLVNDLPPTLPLLLFATSDLPAAKIPYDLAGLFSVSCEQVSEFIHDFYRRYLVQHHYVNIN